MGLAIGQAFWLTLAVTLTGVLHMVVVKMDLLSVFAVPLDGGRRAFGERIFGDNKTWRGVVVMVCGSALLGAVQGLLGGPWARSAGVEPIDFARLGGGTGAAAMALGYLQVNAVLGLGYVLGELPNSFLKRRVGIAPGNTAQSSVGNVFFLIDQADSVLAALGLVMLFFPYPWRTFALGIICLTGLHLVLNAVLYLGKLRRNL
ncbi:MAG: CDP-archaeol synthase [Deltaproteobacteria bacterium]|nr:CDP-archaeol synthase [Deltaproteobacteria bacterium]